MGLPAAFRYSRKYGPFASSVPGSIEVAYDSTRCVSARVSFVVPDMTKLAIRSAAEGVAPSGVGTAVLHSVVAVPPKAQRLYWRSAGSYSVLASSQAVCDDSFITERSSLRNNPVATLNPVFGSPTAPSAGVLASGWD